MSESHQINPSPRPKNKRKGISKGLRFDILNRDGFKCRYCGVNAGDAVLVIDHVIPVAKGGLTVAGNLITACDPCNSGKKAKGVPAEAPSPESEAAMEKARQDALDLAARTLDAYDAKDCLEQGIVNHWCECLESETMDTKTMRVMCAYARQHGVEMVFSWIELATAKHPHYSDTRLGQYISGIRRKWVEGQQK